MTAKDVIIIYNNYLIQAEKESAIIQNSLIEFCHSQDLTVTRVLEYSPGDYQQQDQILSLITGQSSKITVVTNSPISPQTIDYHYYDISYILSTLANIGIIDYYQVDIFSKS